MATMRSACKRSTFRLLFPVGLLFVSLLTGATNGMAQDRLPWLRDQTVQAPTYEPPPPADRWGVERETLPPAEGNSAPRAGAPAYDAGAQSGYDRGSDTYRPPSSSGVYAERRPAPYYEPPREVEPGWRQPPLEPRYADRSPPPYPRDYRDDGDRRPDGTFSMREIVDAGHGFFGSISQGLASVIEYAFKRQGRPNGYILGEDIGGAFVAGLRYGEGRLYTRDAGSHKVYWQGPSIGYDAGAEGSKVMVLVYRLRDPADIYQRFGGVAGSAYVVGGVGLTFQQRDNIVLAPIRAGIGLRLGANVGYLKYTRRPTWNPF
jgi:hypothetical protein